MSRELLIANLTKEINTKHSTQLTNEQVGHWVGSDTAVSDISQYTVEVAAGRDCAVTPSDILDNCD